MLQVQRILKRYGPVTVLSDVTLSIRPGEGIGLIGLLGLTQLRSGQFPEPARREHCQIQSRIFEDDLPKEDSK